MLRIAIVALEATVLAGCVVVANVDSGAWWGDWQEESHQLSAVDSVEFDARGTLYIVQGSNNDLRLEGHEQALRHMEVYERDGTLIVRQVNDEFQWWGVQQRGREVVFYLEMENLTSIKHRGHGEINVGPFTVRSLTCKRKYAVRRCRCHCGTQHRLARHDCGTSLPLVRRDVATNGRMRGKSSDER